MRRMCAILLMMGLAACGGGAPGSPAPPPAVTTAMDVVVTSDRIRALVETLADNEYPDFEFAADALTVLAPKGVIPDLKHLLEHRDDEVRGRAAAVLLALAPETPGLLETTFREYGWGEHLGPQVRRSLPALANRLCALLQGDDEELRNGAAKTIRSLGKKFVPFLDLLLPGLHSDSQDLRFITAGLLAEIVPDHPDLLPVLVEIATTTLNGHERRTAFRRIAALGENGYPAWPHLFPLVEEFRGQDLRELVATIEALHPPAEKTVPLLIGLLGYRDHALISAVIHALGEYGREAAPAFPALLAVSRNYAQALPILPRLAPPDHDPVPLLLEGIASEHKYRRLCSERALVQIGEPAVERLVALINHRDRDISHRAVRTLGAMGPAAAGAIPVLKEEAGKLPLGFAALVAWALIEAGRGESTALSEALAGDGEWFRLDRVLFEMIGEGDEFRFLVPALRCGMGSRDPDTREASAFAYRRVTGDSREACALFAGMLFGSEDERNCGISGLTRLGAEAIPAIPALNRLLDESEGEEILIILGALETISFRRDEGVPVVARMLGHEDPGIRGYAMAVLAELGPGAVPIIIPYVTASESELSIDAIEALGKHSPVQEIAIEALVTAIDHPEEMVAADALYTLGELGPAAKSALPALVTIALRDKDPRAADAQDAIRSIR